MQSAAEALALLAAGVAGGFINAIAGGASLLCMPVLVWLGLAPTVANATNNTATTLQSLFSAWSYARSGFGDRAVVRLLALPSLLGAVTGALVVVALPERAFARVVGVLMLGALVLVVWRRRLRAPREPGPAIAWRSRRGVAAIALFLALGVYGGFFGGGIGLLMLPAIVALFDRDLVTGNGIKSALTFVMNFAAFVIFLSADLIRWAEAGVLSAGMLAGAEIGVRLSVKRGAGWVRGVLAAVTVTAAVYFLLW